MWIKREHQGDHAFPLPSNWQYMQRIHRTQPSNLPQTSPHQAILHHFGNQPTNASERKKEKEEPGEG